MTEQTEQDLVFARLKEGREQFLALVEEVRPNLHRYCARMTGSITDGEDVVQDTLARAYYELSQLTKLPALRSWLFRIAHNRALDYLRSRELRTTEPLEAAEDLASNAPDPQDAVAREQAIHAAVSRFLELPPAQRSCVILKDVLAYSLEEIAAMLDLSQAAVKAALHRGRSRLRQLGLTPQAKTSHKPISPALARYAALFNARDWDGVRAMLVDEVKLDVVSKIKRTGREDVGGYYARYDQWHGWYAVPAWLEGREVLAVLVSAQDEHPSYFIELNFRNDRVVSIRDFVFARYVIQEAPITLATLQD